MDKGKVVVAMSGGVDSSVAAALLKEMGYDVIGVTMRLWSVEQPEEASFQKACCSIEAVDDARRVCQVLDIPHYVMNFEREFEEFVVDYFVDEYVRGRTPNPCLACNQYVKFDFLLQKALGLGASHIATGHYARIAFDGKAYHLRKGIDPGKDQSYVLFTMGQKELAHLLLPIGEISKTETRAIATRLGLAVAAKADSQEICFVPDNNYRRFIEERAGPSKPGKVVDENGRMLGDHKGIIGFTVGQRRGLGIAAKEPLFVTKIDPEYDLVVVGPRDSLFRSDLMASRVSYVSGEKPDTTIDCFVKIRYRAAEVPAHVIPLVDRAKVEFLQPMHGITPGQAVVFYQGDEVLGGGIID